MVGAFLCFSLANIFFLLFGKEVSGFLLLPSKYIQKPVQLYAIPTSNRFIIQENGDSFVDRQKPLEESIENEVNSSLFSTITI